MLPERRFAKPWDPLGPARHPPHLGKQTPGRQPYPCRSCPRRSRAQFRDRAARGLPFAHAHCALARPLQRRCLGSLPPDARASLLESRRTPWAGTTNPDTHWPANSHRSVRADLKQATLPPYASIEFGRDCAMRSSRRKARPQRCQTVRIGQYPDAPALLRLLWKNPPSPSWDQMRFGHSHCAQR